MKALNLMLVVILAVLVGACAKSPFDHLEGGPGVTVTEYADGSKQTQYEGGTYELIKNEASESEWISGCRKWQKEKEAVEQAQYSSLSESERGWALAHKETMRMVINVWGKGEQDVCSPGTNQWDAYIAYVTEHNLTVRQVTSDGFSFAKHALYTYGAIEIVDSLADKMGDRVNGNKTEVGRDQNNNSELVGNANQQISSKDNLTQVGESGSATKEKTEAPKAVVPEEAAKTEEGK